jgi:hypothetical protein
MGRTLDPASQASTPPTAVNPTKPRKIGLGRTDSRTRRSYLTGSQPSTLR